VESVEPLSERVFVNTPLTTNLESRQIFAVDHPLQGYLYYRDRAGHEQQEARAVQHQRRGNLLRVVPARRAEERDILASPTRGARPLEGNPEKATQDEESRLSS